ncbi:glycoside hydrolase family 15 protein [Beijerinckia indica]|uniref:Glucan 1,4-alpha-glucosidase n=1 Tax=Beijerinckia indica subsp. indica (strain ATCC 9039 / DSM 1715 / NCIMB 8712) TaxID=395963 RepID=B2IEP8_BEII9|nr:glycoside hydrolase family 15 protein [Beijerinckia indica]ACB96988.1 Glucan 1,4-alpha-glucosidase [Beijerinckia indica subsp. indica ATCC 9039]
MKLKCFAAALAVASATLSTAHAQSIAPGAPGYKQGWSPANKQGFGTSTTHESNVWFTLGGSGLTDVYFPRIDTPSIRDLQFVVSDGRTFAERESEATRYHVELAAPHSLVYRQINTANNKRYRLTKTYSTDPERAVLLVDVTFESLDGHPYQLYALLNPAPGNDQMHTHGETFHHALVASNGNVASAFTADPPFTRTSNGYLGVSDGWQDLSSHHHMEWTYVVADQGNVVQTGQTTLDGVTRKHLTIAIGFGSTTTQAASQAQDALRTGFDRIAQAYAYGWRRYLASLKPTPASAHDQKELYETSLMVLAAVEDKTYKGAFVASPTMPWAFGDGLDNPSDAYHLVWSRDLYQIASALLAAGDRGAAERALAYLFDHQQKPDGSFPQNSLVDGTPIWGGLQMDEVAFPILLAWQLGRFDGATYTGHVKKAADFIIGHGPVSQAERWENQGGYSPATIAAEIAGLICAADIARRNGDEASARTYESTADTWKGKIETWTTTQTGPFSKSPYYLRLTKDGQGNSGTTYNIGDSGPDGVDQRAVVDPSFLELVRLGIKAADDPIILNTLPVVDTQLGTTTPTGTFWHRYNFDGYGEKRDGSEWNIGFPAGSQATIGRLWPIFAGERGEYDLLAKNPDSARARLKAMAATANDGLLIPEQVWDLNPPSGQPDFLPGHPTTSATPLAWSHAQFVRLAWSIDHGYPLEQPAIVACRYAHQCK